MSLNNLCYVTIQYVIKKTNFGLIDIVSFKHSFIYMVLSAKLCSSKLFVSDYRTYNELFGNSGWDKLSIYLTNLCELVRHKVLRIFILGG